jgi:hypothetical protein
VAPTGHRFWTAAEIPAVLRNRQTRANGPEVTLWNNEALIDVRGMPQIEGGIKHNVLAVKRALCSLFCKLMLTRINIYRFVRTSQETHYVSDTIPTG